MTSPSTVECFNCVQEAKEELPLRERVWRVPGWRVAHSFNSSLPGWLVAMPTRHVEALDELSVEESRALGGSPSRSHYCAQVRHGVSKDVRHLVS
jgi:hypothetical protein